MGCGGPRAHCSWKEPAVPKRQASQAVSPPGQDWVGEPDPVQGQDGSGAPVEDAGEEAEEVRRVLRGVFEGEEHRQPAPTTAESIVCGSRARWSHNPFGLLLHVGEWRLGATLGDQVQPEWPYCSHMLGAERAYAVWREVLYQIHPADMGRGGSST